MEDSNAPDEVSAILNNHIGRPTSVVTAKNWRISSASNMAAEQSQFVVDEVSAVIKEAIESVIGGNTYQHGKVI